MGKCSRSKDIKSMDFMNNGKGSVPKERQSAGQNGGIKPIISWRIYGDMMYQLSAIEIRNVTNNYQTNIIKICLKKKRVDCDLPVLLLNIVVTLW